MVFKGFSSYMTGVLVPVSSLRSEESCGTGEFADLKHLADLCVASKLDLIQILPVNDTGDDASPYNALSAFALHPLYLRLQSLPELRGLTKSEATGINRDIDRLRLKADTRVRYREVLQAKLQILHRLFDASASALVKDPVFQSWRSENEWVRPYAAFRTLKAAQQGAGWQSWRPEYRHGSPEVIDRVWQEGESSASAHFWAWVQWRLSEQFADAATYLAAKGVTLKGDIPIMMNEDSADVWSQLQNFNLDLRAGAPPDMFSLSGQNWGFPIYEWDYLQRHDYDWWRQRLRQADKYYTAYRIDHVLGFFRIWTIPKRNHEGLLGWFKPSIFISQNDLHAIGLDDGRIRWLAEPHLHGNQLRELFGMRSIEIIARFLTRLPNEELYNFRSEIRGERDILESPILDDEQAQLIKLFQERTLLRVDEGLFSPAWNFRDCSRYRQLFDGEKQAFEDLVARRGRESEQLWKTNGDRLLRFMQETTPMLACAEDLGAVPDCVPDVLGSLGILGLKIPRWARRWHEPGSPWIRPRDYPFLSVCAPSVHDTSTLRGWWEHEEGREGFWTSLGLEGPCPTAYGPEVGRQVLSRVFETGSALCVLQIQDFFALFDRYRVTDSAAERVNVPGTVHDGNWSWQLPMTLESLVADVDFSATLAGLVAARRAKKIPKGSR